MTEIRPLPGFDPLRVRWGARDEPRSDNCNYCDAPIPEDSVPLRMWDKDGRAVVFCDACAEACFGLKGFPPEHDREDRQG